MPKSNPKQYIQNSPLSIRAKRSLMVYIEKYYTNTEATKIVDDLKNIDLEELSKLKNIGPKTISEVKDYFEVLEKEEIKIPINKAINRHVSITEIDLPWNIKNAIVRYLKKNGKEIRMADIEKIEFNKMRASINFTPSMHNTLKRFCTKYGIQINQY